MPIRVLSAVRTLGVALLITGVLSGCAELARLNDALSGAAAVEQATPPTDDAAPAAAPPAAAPVQPVEIAPVAEAALYPGTGVFVGRAPVAVVGVTAEGGITLNFVDASLREVIRSILGDTLNVNYVIDPTVQGLVTLQTSQPLPRAAVLPTLEQILRLNGAVMVEAEGLYRIIPVDQVARSAARPRQGGVGGPGYGLQVVSLENIAAAEMEKILKPVAPPGGVVLVDRARNVIILAGTQLERSILLEIVGMFDVDWLSGMSFAMVPLVSADAKAVVDDLENVFGDKAGGPLTGLVEFVPIERLASILVITSRPDYLQRAVEWIERFDSGGEGVEKRLYVYYVQNGRAADLAGVLNDVFSPSDTRRGSKTEPAPGVQPARGAAAPASDAPASDGEAPSLEQAAPEPVVRADDPRGIAVSADEDLRIIADEVSNALVILATPRQYRMIVAMLRKLDIVPLQVLIETTIAEVTLNEELKYGVQWLLDSGNTGAFTLSEAATGVAAQQFPGFSYLFSIADDVRVVLNALDSVTDVNIISSPQIMVLDNQPARIQVGDRVPIATQSVVSVTDPDAPIVNQIEFVDTGVILEVTPRVNASGMVIMEINQQVSDVVATTTSGIDSPTIQQRQISSMIAVQDGETIALGGLIREKTTETDVGVPLLKDIPILGALFSKTSNKVERTELLILITPRVVGDRQDARAVTDELRRRLRAVVPLGARIE